MFASFAHILGPHIYPIVYPDWKKSQRDWVEKICKSEKIEVWVAALDDVVAGLVAYELNEKEKTGEIQFLAVHPAYQNNGVGTLLNEFALAKMRAAGMLLAVVGTGGDDSHTAARRSYEKAGYTALPLVRYYRAL